VLFSNKHLCSNQNQSLKNEGLLHDERRQNDVHDGRKDHANGKRYDHEKRNYMHGQWRMRYERWKKNADERRTVHGYEWQNGQLRQDA